MLHGCWNSCVPVEVGVKTPSLSTSQDTKRSERLLLHCDNPLSTITDHSEKGLGRSPLH